MVSPSPAIPKGSVVLITGLTGYIATHTAKKLLDEGYNIRGTVCNLSSASWLIEDLFASEYAAGQVELVEVPDLAHPGAFDDAVKGVSGVEHIATITSLDPDPSKVIPPTVEGALSLLRAAAKEPSVRRVVFTGSAGSAFMPLPGVPGHIGRDSWNEDAVKAAQAPPPYTPERGIMTYMASKVEAEKAVLNFMKVEKPSFVLNVVSPFTTLGKVFHKSHIRGSVSWIS